MLRRSIVVPLYQESTRICGTVRRLADSELCEAGTEFLFVDDGSTDETVAVLEQSLAGSGLQATVLRLPSNEGKGAAVRTGVLASRGQTVAFVDADLSSPPSAILQVLAAVETGGAQVALASRAHRTSDITVRQPLARETAGKTFNRLIRLLGLTRLPDTQCGLKAFDRPSALALFEPLVTRRFAFDVELLARADRMGLRIEVIPTQWAHVEESRVAPLRDGLRMAWDAVRVARAMRRSTGLDR
jgi:dolichyl-phosphate beta-glucosyltransferase